MFEQSSGDTYKVLNEYRILQRLGRGSYAKVYKCSRLSSGELFAVKVIDKTKLTPSRVEQTLTEIKLMKILHHPNIVEMKDFLWDDRAVYIILEYCEHGDLSTLIQKQKKLPEKTCQKFLAQLGKGLSYLRSHNVSHFDLKPQNLLLHKAPDLTLKIADFGFAQFLPSEGEENFIKGTPLYMAPEMLLKKKYGPQADLWSIGVILYQCLFGKPPLPVTDELFTALKAHTPIEIPNTPKISEDCFDLLKGLLVYDPKGRMSLDDFFMHPFLDLEHFPSDDCYDKALSLIHAAIRHDLKKEYDKAFELYCKGVKFLVSYINYLPPGEKKEFAKKKVLEYMERAEEIKVTFFKLDSKRQSVYKAESAPWLTDASSPLVHLCSSTPALASALEIGRSGQMYLVEGSYELALEKLKMSLSTLVPLLAQEPGGIRRDLLSKQVQGWLSLAESIKALLVAGDISRETPPVTPSQSENEPCSIQ